jgi:hypothetical protein
MQCKKNSIIKYSNLKPDDDDDPDGAQLDGGDNGDDFPLREGISPTDFCMPESFLSVCVFRPA